MVTGDNGTTAHQIAKQCQMVTPRMKLYKIGDDEERLENDLKNFNTQSKQFYINLRKAKEGKAAPKKFKAPGLGGGGMGLNSTNTTQDWGGGESLLSKNEDAVDLDKVDDEAYNTDDV